MLKKIVFLIIIHLIVLPIQAQSEEFIFKNYDIQDGLCDNNITSIIEDQKGFIWIATREGLSRFDGAEFKTFHFPNASGNHYSSFRKFGSDTILLLNNFRLALFKTSNNSLQIVPAFKKDYVANITDIGNSMYALLIGNSFHIINKKFETIGIIPFNPNQKAQLSIQKLKDGKLLVANFGEFYLYDIALKKLTPFRFEFPAATNPDFDTFDLEFVDETHRLIYISDYFTGLYLFDFEGKLVKKYSYGDPKEPLVSTSVWGVFKTNDGKIWANTDKGISILEKNKTISIEHKEGSDLSLKGDIVTCIYEDKKHNLWIGTVQGMSVYKNDLNRKLQKRIYAPEAGHNVANIIPLNNELYVASYLNSTYKINLSDGKTTTLTNVPNAWTIRNIDGKICIYGASKEVVFYDPKSNNYQRNDFLKNYFTKSDIVTLTFRHSNGDMWYSGNVGGGFVRVIANSNTIEHYKNIENNKNLFSSSYYYEVAEDAQKNLWFGMNKTNLLLKWNYKTKTFSEYDFNKWKETGNRIFGGIASIKTDTDKKLWIAFEGGGIVKFDPIKNSVEHFSIENGLNTNFINNIEFDTKKRLWILTNKGVSCLNTINKTVHHMDVWDGFTANPLTYNVLKMDPKRNLMWIGATNCLYSFNPDKIIRNKSEVTKIYLDGIKVNNSRYISLTDASFDFKANENNLEFEIVAVDIENGKNLEYSYKLEGFNNEWIDLKKNRTILFPKLDAGNYVFNARVRAKGSNNWVYLSRPFEFSIAYYWYESWWFYSILTLACIALLFLIIYFYFRRKLEKQKIELEKQKAIEDERKRIAKDMHDDLGSGLTKITYLSQMAMLNKDSDEKIVSINKTSTELVESMSEIIWVMKDENNSWEELLLFIKKYAVEYCSNNNLSVHFDYPDTLLQSELSSEKRRNLFLSIKEVLHNIVKHAKATDVTVKVLQNDKIHIIIADNGIGISSSKSQKPSGGNGQKNITERMKLVNATFSISENNGTQIHFIIPV